MPAQGAETLCERPEQMLRSHGHRYTRARRGIVSTLAEVHRPMTVSELVEAIAVPISSLYRSVALMCDQGILDVVHGVDRPERFELSEALRGDHHHHLVCADCGAIAAFVPPADLELLIGALGPQLAAERDFELTRHTLELIGACTDCRGDANRQG